MVRFEVKFRINAPSSWGVEECKTWVGKILSSDEEMSSLEVKEIERSGVGKGLPPLIADSDNEQTQIEFER